MGWDVEFFWFIPHENMTEARFCNTLKSMVDLPQTSVPFYEPVHPEAPLFTSVKLPMNNILVNGMYMSFMSSTESWGREGQFALPEGIEWLASYWRKWEISGDPEMAERFLATIGKVADGMGAVFGMYTSELHMEHWTSLQDFFTDWHGYLFLSHPYVEIVGRDRLDGMGTILRTETGMAVLFDGPFADEAGEMLKELWVTSGLNRQQLTKRQHERPPYVKERQAIHEPPPYEEQSPIPQGGYFGPFETLDSFFVFYYPVENHSRSRYEAFFGSLMERKKDPRYQRLPYTPPTPSEDAESLIESGQCLLLLERMDKEAQEEGPQNDLGMKMVDGFNPPVAIRGRDPPGALKGVVISANDLTKAEHVTQFIRVLELFTSALEPVYGFGSSNKDDFLHWFKWGMHDRLYLWPINMFPVDGSMLPVVRGFHERNADSWSLQSTEGGHAFLVFNDPGRERDGLLDEPASNLLDTLRGMGGSQ